MQRLRLPSLRRHAAAARRPSLLAVEAYGDPVSTDRYAALGVRPPAPAGVRPLVTATVPHRPLAAAS